MDFLLTATIAASITTAAILLGTGVLHGLPRLGGAGKAISGWLCRGFGLDLVVTYFTALPIILGPIFAGWAGLLGGVVGQYLGLIGWTIAHEIRHRGLVSGRPRIVRSMNAAVGAPMNMISVFWTSLAVPVFWVIRMTEWIVYPPLVWMVDLPRYDSKQWVNVTRHKFDGLIGHDRVWCLYCDWMTGVWSMGSEMLRNIETYWCPIQFGDTSKCENCKHDFPDVEERWVPFNADVSVAAKAWEQHYGKDGEVSPRSWWGHPSRVPLHVNGELHESDGVEKTTAESIESAPAETAAR